MSSGFHIKFKDHLHHYCELPVQHDPNQFSVSGRRIGKIRKYIRKLMVIQKSKHILQYYPSMKSVRTEQRRQMSNPRYRYVVHPFSPFSMRKQYFLSIIWLVLLVMESYLGSFCGRTYYEKGYVLIDLILFFLNFLVLIDTIIRFFTGIIIYRIREVVLEPDEIVRKYLLGYFFFDIVPIISSFIFYTSPIPIKGKVILHEFRVIRLARMKDLIKFAGRFMYVLGFKRSLRNMTCFLAMALIIIHEWTCLFGYFNFVREIYDAPISWLARYYHAINLEKNTTVLKLTMQDMDTMQSLKFYIVHLSAVISHFLGCSTYRFKIDFSIEMMFFAFVLMSGLAFYVYALARVLQFFCVFHISAEKYEELLYQIEDYMLKKNFPIDVKKRITKYYDYKYNKNYFSEHLILACLNEHLRMEVLLYACRPLISEVRMFQDMSRAAIGCILALLKQEIYLPHDLILSTDEKNESIYFILYGTCSVTLLSGKELTHEEDGQQLSDTSLYVPDARVGYFYAVRALEVSEIYELKKADINYCCNSYPEFVSKMEVMMRSQAQDYNRVYMLRENEEAITDEILDQLRRGRILEKGFKREEFGTFD